MTTRPPSSRPPSATFAAAPDATRLFVRSRKGPGNVWLVLSDGIACDGFIWKYLWDDLGEVASVAHWNYRGHGRSSPPADASRIELVDHARDLDAVRESIGDPPVVLVGHSMGCQVSLEAYRLRPEKVRGIVLICGAPGRITYTFKGTDVLAKVLPRLIERVNAHPEIVRALWGRMPADVALRLAMLTGDIDRSIHPDDVMPYLQHMVDIDVPMFLRMLRSAGEHSAVDLLPKVEVPALVIGGDRDTFTPARYAEEMAKAMPRGELLMVAGGTHIVPLERRDLVRERVLRFLRERVEV
ncbi:MAG: alpha/beta hydrolase [Polyangiaceae bacterium]|nr:alpha/beta hydrolase [Polyangiaceae bacterium]